VLVWCILTNNIPPNHADFEIINMFIDDKYILSLIVFFVCENGFFYGNTAQKAKPEM
jgi:hypothetical protein